MASTAPTTELLLESASGDRDATDALFTMAIGGLDALVLDDLLVEEIPAAWRDLIPWWRQPSASLIRRDLYTF